MDRLGCVVDPHPLEVVENGQRVVGRGPVGNVDLVHTFGEQVGDAGPDDVGLVLAGHHGDDLHRAGTPTTVVPSGTTDSGSTTAPAPTTHRLPMVTRSQMTAPAPIRVSSPISTSPQMVTPGEMVTKSPIRHRVMDTP